jgi:hypothetical protein
MQFGGIFVYATKNLTGERGIKERAFFLMRRNFLHLVVSFLFRKKKFTLNSHPDFFYMSSQCTQHIKLIKITKTDTEQRATKEREQKGKINWAVTGSSCWLMNGQKSSDDFY